MTDQIESLGGLPCPSCQKRQSQVIDSRTRTYTRVGRKLDHRVSRRRVCLSCGHRFSTDERYADMDADRISAADRLAELAAEIQQITTRIRSDPAA